MALDRKAVLDKAHNLVVKGKLQDALAEYERLLAEQPKDETILNTVGDLYSRLKNVPEAVKYYKKLAEYYAERGFAVKAIAVYKRIVRMDPASIENSLRLADIQAHQGFSNEAKVLYAAIAERCSEGGMKDKAIEILKKIVAIDPGALQQRLQLADLYRSRARQDEACHEYLDVGKKLLEKGSFDDAIRVFQKGLEANAGHAGILSALGEAYAEKGEFKSALKLYEDLLKKDARNVEVLLNLGKVHFRAKDMAKAEQCFIEAQKIDAQRVDGFLLLADHYRNQGEVEQAFKWFEKTALEIFAAKGNPAVLEHPLKTFLADQSQHAEAFGLLAQVYERNHRQQDMIYALDGQAQAHIARKDFEKAEAVLRRLVSLDPDNAQHQTRLRYVETRGKEGASGAPKGAAPPPAAPKPSAQRLMTVDVALENEEDHIQEVLTEADVFVKYGLIAKATDRLQNAKAQFPSSIEIVTKLISIYTEQGNRAKAVEECVHLSKLFRQLGDDQAASDILADAREIDPSHPLLKNLAAPAAAEPSAVEEEEEIEVDMDLDEDLEVEVEEEVEPAAAPEAVKTASLEESLEEADFYISQGFVKEALDLLEKLQQRFPNEPRILNKMRKLRPEVAPAAPEAKKTAPAPAPAKPAETVAAVMKEIDALEADIEDTPTPGEDFFDLASELEEEFMAGETPAAAQEEPDLGEMFASFKKGVEAQVDAQDFGTHYDLGIAYKEMGLVDDAIAEFQVAAKNPDKSRYRDCCSMLGLCFMEKGMAGIAAKWYRKGLDVQGISEEDRMGLLYDFASALEANGDVKEALDAYSEVYGLDSKYRDVARKVKELRAASRG
jgi:tetratricopeptide (TPR) repeat protein